MQKIPHRFCEVVAQFRLRVETALKDLLENKHLYQQTLIAVDDLKTPIKRGHGRMLTWAKVDDKSPQESNDWIDDDLLNLPALATDCLSSAVWKFAVETPETRGARPIYPKELKSEPICFLPRLSRSCSKCGERTAHLPQYFGELKPQPLANLDFGKDDSDKKLQVLVTAYQCQVCHGEPNVFVVRRHGLKLSLVGRSIFEKVSLPKFIPETVKRYYSEALVASTAGKFLPACLYLRLVIEHHIRSTINPSSIPDRATGDQLADEYSKVLHPEFPRSLYSLKSIYSNLSEVIHEGREDADVFGASLDSITKHFDQVRLLPLQDWKKQNSHSASNPEQTAQQSSGTDESEKNAHS